jgi:hypothetical protein
MNVRLFAENTHGIIVEDVRDSEGDLISGADVQFRVFDRQDNIVAQVQLGEVEPGEYAGTFTPNGDITPRNTYFTEITIVDGGVRAQFADYIKAERRLL